MEDVFQLFTNPKPVQEAEELRHRQPPRNSISKVFPKPPEVCTFCFKESAIFQPIKMHVLITVL